MAELDMWDVIARLCTAAGLGAIVGAERDADGQDAGLRTHLMLALGAAVFGIVSVGGFDTFAAPRDSTNFQVDVTRIASYVAAGIGFLGGGVILKHAGTVKGLTTAASLWVVAAVGLACGVGFWQPAVVGTAIGILSLVALRPVRALLQRLRRDDPRRAVVVLRAGARPGDVVGALLALPVAPEAVSVGAGEDGATEVVARFGPADGRVLASSLAAIAVRDDVEALHAG